MSVRFSAESQAYTSTSSAPAGTYTVTWWAYMSVDRNAWATMWDSATSTSLVTQVAASPVEVFVVYMQNATSASSYTVTPFAWHCFGLSQSAAGGTLTGYYGTSPSSLTSFTGTAQTTGTPSTLRIGASIFGDEWWNGRIANFKHWSSVLTQAQIAVELGQYAPAVTSGLVRRHDFITANTADQSGNGRTLSGGTGATTEADPPGIVSGGNTSSLLPFFA